VIHTGDRQLAALRFYDRHGYTPIGVFPPYEAVTYSRCFEKVF
jgi:ribosomal protein S18 acetylase RimI-like enzyme